MPLLLSELEELQQAVESTEPREILKKVLNGKNEDKKRRIVDVLQVDLHKVNPVYFYHHMKYTRKYCDNMFMFIDKQYKILGFLKGNKWSSEYIHAEDYEKTKQGRSSYNRWTVEKKQKTLWDRAYHILMFESHDFKKIKVNIGFEHITGNQLQHERNEVVNNLKRSMNERLFNYRVEKYEYVTYQSLMCMVNQIINLCAAQYIQEDPNFLKKVRSFKDWYYRSCDNIEDFLKRFLNEVEELKKAHHNYQRYSKENHYYQNKYLENKINIIKFFNRFFKIG